jgi:dihydrodipicolinate reductase
MPQKIAIAGASGRMGRMLIEALLAAPDLTLGAALDRAGRVAYAALCGHGTITDGRPEVVELHALDGSNGNALISLAAAAESAAEPGEEGPARGQCRTWER